MVDFHHSTTSRPATEETLLSLYASDADASNAEFIRLYQSIEFPGRALVQAEEQHRIPEAWGPGWGGPGGLKGRCSAN